MSLRHIPYGYRIEKGTPVIVPEEAEIVSRIFHRYDDGETLLAVADSLTEQQIDYYEGKRQWNKNMIARILENRKYIGEETYSLGVCITVSADIAASDNIKTIHIIFSTYLDLTFRNHSIIAFILDFRRHPPAKTFQSAVSQIHSLCMPQISDIDHSFRCLHNRKRF